jgi:Ni,Fe-hydrogenase maturation factor
MKSNTARLLVIGYGDPLRGDDGAGRLVVEELETSLRNTSYADYVEMTAFHQLTSALAETVSRFQSVIFVGVCCGKNAGVVCCKNIELPAADTETVETEDIEIAYPGDEVPDDSKDSNNAMTETEQISPELLVYLARTKHNANQDAVLYTISGSSFEQGEKILRPVKRGVRFVVEDIRETILRQFKCYESECADSSLADSQSKGLLGTANLGIAEVV